MEAIEHRPNAVANIVNVTWVESTATRRRWNYLCGVAGRVGLAAA